MREPDYEEKNKLIQDTLLSDPVYVEIRNKVFKELVKDAPTSIKTIQTLRDTSLEDHIKLKSAKELLTIAGFVNQKIEFGGSVEIRPYSTEDDLDE